MCKLVMIDDNPIEHLIMQRLFDRYKVFRDAVHSLDSRIIIEFLREEGKNEARLPDVIFLDLDMPKFSGWEFLEQFGLLCVHWKKTVSVYIISSSVSEQDKLRSRQFPFVREFISKPIMKDKLEMLYAIHTND